MAVRSVRAERAASSDELVPPGLPVRRRAYDNAGRLRQAAQTRRRIIEAGAQLLRRSPIREWDALTIRAVAELAGVSERTVYRHFGNERALRDAVLHQLEEQSGIELAAMRLEDVAGVAARIFSQLSSYPSEPPRPLDPTLSEAKRRQHDALVLAVGAAAPQWTDQARRTVAALIDVQWSVAAYERMVGDWDLDPTAAAAGIGWIIGLVEAAVRRGERPAEGP